MTEGNLKAQGKSIGARLSRIASERKVSYEKILTDFLIERMVARITADETLARHLVFKGGYVALRVFRSPRFTIDLDAVIHKMSPEEAIQRAITVIGSKDLHDGVWFRFESKSDLRLQNEYGGTRLVFRSGCGEILKDLRRAQVINFDIGVGDPVVPGPLTFKMDALLGNDSLSWLVYSRESIVAEKIHSLIVRGSGSSRSKDIYDLDFLIHNCSPKNLHTALQETFAFRNDELPNDLHGILTSLDRETLRRGWVSAVSDVTGESLDNIFDRFLSSLAQKLK